VHKTYTSLRSKLVHTKPTPDAQTAGGVYVIPCRDCPQSYIGETGRPFKTRLNEHKGYVRNAKHDKSVFIHVRDNDHQLDWDAAKIIHHSNDRQNRLIVESALIKHLPNFNDKPGLCSVDLATKNIIFNSNPQILRNLPHRPP